MRSQNAFYDDVLGRVADDYEAPHTIAGDLSRDLNRAPMIEQLIAHLHHQQIPFGPRNRRHIQRLQFRNVRGIERECFAL